MHACSQSVHQSCMPFCKSLAITDRINLRSVKSGASTPQRPAQLLGQGSRHKPHTHMYLIPDRPNRGHYNTS